MNKKLMTEENVIWFGNWLYEYYDSHGCSGKWKTWGGSNESFTTAELLIKFKKYLNEKSKNN